jgi:hypothetical protein
MEMAVAASGNVLRETAGSLLLGDQGGNNNAKDARDDVEGGRKLSSPSSLKKRVYCYKSYVICLAFCVVIVNMLSLRILDAVNNSQMLRDIFNKYNNSSNNCICPSPPPNHSENNVSE